ncbi:MAG: hypothetical protein Q7R61_00275 [bacterium]|nr:hypothetical protein [bacterium]
MKKFLILIIAAILLVGFINPKPANAGDNTGWVFLGGFLLGSVLGPHDRIIIGPVYSTYPSYQPPVIYQPQQIWVPAHYEWRWQTVCEYMYQRQNCYQAQITVFIPGHWEYR